jgi:hypothetical protein
MSIATPDPSKWEETQAWATKKIADVVDFSLKRGDRLLAGHDLRDTLTTLEQRQKLLIEQAHKLRRNTINVPKKGNNVPNMGKNEQLFDMFAEKIAKKLSEIEKKRDKPDLFGPKDGS